MAIDDRTSNLSLPLPNVGNIQSVDDVPRLREAITTLDAVVHALQLAVTSKADQSAVTAAINNLVNSAPGALNQLNELAAALGNDPNFATTISTALAGKLPNAPATTTVLGGVKIGAGLVVDIDGTLSVVSGGGGTGLPAYTDLYLVPSSNGQTTFTVSGGYSAGLIDVILNGVLLQGGGDDYVASNGTTVVLTVGINTADTLQVRRWAYIPSNMAVSKTGDTLTGALNFAPAASVASASIVSIGTLASNNITVTGTTAITSLGAAAPDGSVRALTFTGALVLTHNDTSMILPGAANITTAPGDVAEFISLGGGNWRCRDYTRASGDKYFAVSSPELHFMMNL